MKSFPTSSNLFTLSHCRSSFICLLNINNVQKILKYTYTYTHRKKEKRDDTEWSKDRLQM